MGIESIATTGMQAAMSDMEVISNNIANAATPGFKKSMASFSDIFPSGNNASGTQIGLGVNLASVTQDFDASGPTPTDIQSNLCIQGSGFFPIKDLTSGQVFYSRNGQFTFDEATGTFLIGNQRLQGFQAVNGVIPSGGSPTDLTIDMSAITGQPTTTMTQSGVNLGAASPVITTPPAFSPSQLSTFNFSSSTTVYDSLGTANTISLYYAKSGSNTWSVYATATPPNGSATILNGGSPGTLTFNDNGTLSSATGLSALSFSPTSGAQSPQLLNAVMTGITQFGNTNTSGQFTCDGSAAGNFYNYAFDNNGQVWATYTNGDKVLAGQAAIANFASPQALQYVGNGAWSATTASGQPNTTPSNSQNNITPLAVESSNVDMAAELVSLITAQNTFQANAQVEQTYNQVMQTVTKL